MREGGGGRRGGRVSSSPVFSPLHIVTYSLTHQLLAVVATITFSIVAKGGDGGESTGAEKKGGRDEEKDEEEGKVGEEQRESEEGKGEEEKEEREEEGKGGEEAEEKDEEAKGWEDVGMETAGDGEEKLVEDENVDNLTAADGRTNSAYSLYGIVHHSGALSSGHYASSVREAGGWKLFNDDKVQDIEDENVLVDPTAYLLFYVRKDVQNASIENFWSIGENTGDPVDIEKLLKEREKNCVIS